MREIQHLMIDKATGDAVLTTRMVPGDADVAERFRQLKAGLPEEAPESGRRAWVRCDGCGYAAEVDFDHPELPGGWTTVPDGDYCPRCGISN